MTNPTMADFKRGDTFMLTCTHKVDGVPQSVTGFSIASQVRDALGSLVATMNAVFADQQTLPGVFYLSPAVADTSGWPLGSLLCDIQITEGGVIRSSSTFTIPVVEDITK